MSSDNSENSEIWPWAKKLIVCFWMFLSCFALVLSGQQKQISEFSGTSEIPQIPLPPILETEVPNHQHRKRSGVNVSEISEISEI